MKHKTVLSAGAALLLAIACGSKSTGNGTDGHTHWLSRCVIDEDCEQGLQCLCGACTSECAGDSECASASNGDAPICGALSCSGSGVASACTAAEGTASDASPTELGGRIGDVCVPGDEYAADFSGYSVTEVSIAENDQCGSDLCLVHHFQGRVTCPYGNDPEGAASCTVAGGGAPVEVRVQPQLVERSPEDAVYCSCRCDGPDSAEDYCECPDGFSCTSLIEFAMPGFEEYAGSYCVAEGTQVSPEAISPQLCSGDDCGPADEYASLAAATEPAQPATVNVFIDMLNQPQGGELGCMPRALSTEGGAVSCAVVEAGPDLACDVPAREPAEPTVARTIYAQLARLGACADAADCEATHGLCEIVQLTSSSAPEQAASCLNDAEPSGDGFCYLDVSAGLGNPELVEHCPTNAQRSIRFVGAGAPRPGTLTFIACIGSL